MDFLISRTVTFCTISVYMFHKKEKQVCFFLSSECFFPSGFNLVSYSARTVASQKSVHLKAASHESCSADLLSVHRMSLK